MPPSDGTLGSTRVLLAGTADWVECFGETLRDRTTASVRLVTTVDAALDAVSEGGVDCVLTGYEFEASTGVDLLRSIRTGTASLPVLLCTTAGSEAVASEAIAAGLLQPRPDRPAEAVLGALRRDQPPHDPAPDRRLDNEPPGRSSVL